MKRASIAVAVILSTFSFQALATDTDGDDLLDAIEVQTGTNPGLFDTDGDGLGDGAEFASDTYPVLVGRRFKPRPGLQVR